MGEIKVVPFTIEGFIGDLEELAQDFDKWKSPEYTAFMTAAAYIRELTEYRSIGTPSELAELVKARGEGRMLPEGFSCVMLSDEKTLAVFYPEGKCVASEPRQYFTVSEKKEAL